MRTLIVDKTPESIELLTSHTARYGEVTVVTDAAQAFASFCAALDSGTPFDLVCLDTQLPPIDGIDLLVGLRDYEESKGIVATRGAKIIVTTDICSIDNYYAANSAGCTAFICKPLDREKFSRELQRLGIA
jgi:two-component system chemotaxis response regulator CheY